jgi:hypothetical protein
MGIGRSVSERERISRASLSGWWAGGYGVVAVKRRVPALGGRGRLDTSPRLKPWPHTTRRSRLPRVTTCKCGCGEPIKRGRTFVNREHQLDWMFAGGASQMNAMQPIEGKIRGGATSGQQAVESGRLLEAAKKGGKQAREFAAEYRAKHQPG